jgi:hypothetical protein
MDSILKSATRLLGSVGVVAVGTVILGHVTKFLTLNPNFFQPGHFSWFIVYSFKRKISPT